MIKGTGMVGFNKPLALMCYICGREYGTKSLGIHMKTCVQKWEIEEGKKPRNQRRPLPKPPAGLDELLAKPNITAADIQDFNTGAFNKYNNEALVRCHNCNRTFKPEALVHHEKACSKDNPFKPLPGGPNSGSQGEYADNDAANLQPCTFCGRKFAADRLSKHESVCTKMDKSKLKTPTKTSFGEAKTSAGGAMKSGGGSSSSSYSTPIKQPIRPKSLVCFICGRDYGTKSLRIHLKTCEEKWHIEQNKLPKRERRPIPQPPPGLFELLEKHEITFEDLERYNNRAFDSYNYSALVPCNHCGRTFKPEALVHHAKVCTAENPFKPLPNRGANGGGNGEYEEGSAADLLPCGKCGRKFASDRIQKHELVCKGTGGNGIMNGGKGSSSTTKTAPMTQKQPASSYETKIPVRPKTLVCYICGREYGTTSLAIHLKTCEQKWYIEQDKLPKKDRRPCPKPPAQLTALLNGEIKIDQMEKYNNQAFDSYNNDALLPCKHCNRTFTQTALQHHSKVCTAEKPFKPLTRAPKQEDGNVNNGTINNGDVNNGNADNGTDDIPIPSKGYNLSNIPNMSGGGGGDDEMDLVPCDSCGRNFNADRIAKHSKVCKGPTELKKKEPEQPKAEKPKKDGAWKKQHEEFIANMKYMKEMKKVQDAGGDIRQLAPPPRSNTDHLVPCPYCGRKFAEQTAERHIPSCKNIINKPKSIAQSAARTIAQQGQPQSQFGSTGFGQQKYAGSTNLFNSNSPMQTTSSKMIGQSSQIKPTQSKNIFLKK